MTDTLPLSIDGTADDALFAGQPVRIVERDGVRYTLLGTAHVSHASVEAVEKAIHSGRFDAVAVELDPQRLQAILEEVGIDQALLQQPAARVPPVTTTSPLGRRSAVWCARAVLIGAMTVWTWLACNMFTLPVGFTGSMVCRGVRVYWHICQWAGQRSAQKKWPVMLHDWPSVLLLATSAYYGWRYLNCAFGTRIYT